MIMKHEDGAVQRITGLYLCYPVDTTFPYIVSSVFCLLLVPKRPHSLTH